jgi:hypothetical protein
LSPPLAVQAVAPGALQLRVRVCPVLIALCWRLEVSVTGIYEAPSVTRPPVWALSRIDWSVADPVELVASEVELQTAESEVYRAVAVEGLGAGGDAAGQIPAEFAPSTS